RLADPQLSALPVAGIGGLFEDALFRETVQRGLRAQLPHARLADAAGDALGGGRLLASTRHEPLTRLPTSACRNEETWRPARPAAPQCWTLSGAAPRTPAPSTGRPVRSPARSRTAASCTCSAPATRCSRRSTPPSARAASPR